MPGLQPAETDVAMGFVSMKPSQIARDWAFLGLRARIYSLRFEIVL
jgi:hypothetical protein